MDPIEEAQPDFSRAFRGLNTRMEAYEAQQNVGNTLETILEKLSMLTPTIATPKTPTPVAADMATQPSTSGPCIPAVRLTG
ncbi:hypothetical protein XELAEV_18042035mg [Xenopus laevis]|uniref:Uncharacterized protein n=1 Tax=Xenopus laevis TaxID=8355 RepID=A0A974C3G5_XENLA|nr:hypothetical protein XELAEV_18042035mg [Xenopus laevis]